MSPGPILCGVDFSEDSRQALRIAKALATALTRELLIVTVLDPLIAEALKVRDGDAFNEQTAADLGTFASATFAAKASGAKTLVAVGDPARQLAQVAVDHHASLIVVGTRGLGGAKRAFFGSTTLRLLRGATHPVLAVPHETDVSTAGPSPFGHVVCGIDFSESSVDAAKTAVELGVALGVPVTLVHGVAPITVPTAWDALARAAAGDRLADTTSHLNEIAASLGPPAPAAVAKVGATDDVICGVAASHPRPLIVLGLGGTGGHRPGTHAYRLLAQAKAPVLVAATHN